MARGRRPRRKADRGTYWDDEVEHWEQREAPKKPPKKKGKKLPVVPDPEQETDETDPNEEGDDGEGDAMAKIWDAVLEHNEAIAAHATRAELVDFKVSARIAKKKGAGNERVCDGYRAHGVGKVSPVFLDTYGSVQLTYTFGVSDDSPSAVASVLANETASRLQQLFKVWIENVAQRGYVFTEDDYRELGESAAFQRVPAEAAPESQIEQRANQTRSIKSSYAA